jgi:hypothetical protein
LVPKINKNNSQFEDIQFLENKVATTKVVGKSCYELLEKNMSGF